MKNKIFYLIFVFMLSASGYFQFRYDSRVNYFSEKQVFLSIPNGKTLKVLSFGYQNLMADLLFIWSIQFYATYNITNSYDYLEHIFNVITDISPQYKEPYIVGSWIMALEAYNTQMAINLLQKGARNMPNEWIFDYESGYYANKHLKDYELAEKFFKKALRNPSSPRFIRRQQAHMVYMKDDLNKAYQLWMEIYKNADERLELRSAKNHLHQIKFEMDKKILEPLIKKFKQIYNRYPSALQELEQIGFIKEIPKDFDGDDYIYYREKGTIRADKVLQWKK